MALVDRAVGGETVEVAVAVGVPEVAAASALHDHRALLGHAAEVHPEVAVYHIGLGYCAGRDGRFDEAVKATVAAGGPTDGLRQLFADDDWFTDADSNACRWFHKFPNTALKNTTSNGPRSRGISMKFPHQNLTIEVPLVQMNALMGLLSETLMTAIAQSPPRKSRLVRMLTGRSEKVRLNTLGKLRHNSQQLRDSLDDLIIATKTQAATLEESEVPPSIVEMVYLIASIDRPESEQTDLFPLTGQPQ